MSRSKHSYRGQVRGSAKQSRDTGEFRCSNCRAMVSNQAVGTGHRNHCPACLWSKHVDKQPGDRAATCRARMEPIAVWVKNQHEWAIVHRCIGCGVLKSNRIAGDDNEFALISLASRPIASPPFPLDPLFVQKPESN